MPTEEQIKKFRERLEQPLRQDAADELESGISLMRAEIALRKFRDMPHRIVEGVMDELWPNVSRGFAKEIVETIIDFAERNEDKGLGLNPQRIEWLKRWADEQSEKMGENVDKLYEFSEDEKKIIEKAIKSGMLKRDGDRYKWLLLNKSGKPSNADLAYFCGRLICGDYVKESKRVLDYKMGGDKDFPEKTIEWLFSVRNIRQSRNQLGKMKKKTENQKKIDGLFE